MLKQNKSNRLVIKALSNTSRVRIPRNTIEWSIDQLGLKTLYPESYLALLLSSSHKDISYIKETSNELHVRSLIETPPIKEVWRDLKNRIIEYRRQNHSRIERATRNINEEVEGMRMTLASATSRTLKTLYKKEKRFERVLALCNKLEKHSVLPWEISSPRKFVQEVRSSFRPIRESRESLFKSKITDYKNSWSTMLPDRVQDTFLPKGTAIGVEIEYLARCFENDEGHYDTSLIQFDTPNPPIHGVGFGYDCSLRASEPYHYTEGREVRIMLRYGKWSRLHKLCDHLKRQKVEVNKTCGLHIHLDCRNLTRSATITRGKRLESALPWLFQIVPPSRRWSRQPGEKYPEGRENQYCLPLFEEGSKYAAINMSAYRSGGRKTIEVRVHSSSLNPDKIVNWIELLVFLKDSYKHFPTWESFMESEAPIHLKIWANKRREKFSTELTKKAEEDDHSEQIQEIIDSPPVLPPLPNNATS